MARVWNNIEMTVPTAGTDITFYKTSGTDTATSKYMGFGLNVTMRAIIIDPDKNVLLTQINNEAAKNGKTIRGDKGFTLRADSLLNPWSSFIIKTTQATTKLTVTVFALGQ